jgi:hypothetical protein
VQWQKQKLTTTKGCIGSVGDWGHRGATVAEVIVFYLFIITRSGHCKSLASQNIIFIGMHQDCLG